MARNILFDIIAPFYDLAAKPREADGRLEYLKLPTEGLMFEAGGGTGRIALGFVPYIDVVVLGDLSFNMLQRAKLKPALRVLQHRVESLPFKEQTFDRILVVDAFHHFNDQEKAISELLRVLKHGGRLVIEEPNIESFAVKLIAIGERLLQMDSHILPAEKIQAICSRWNFPITVHKEKHTVLIMVDKEQSQHHV